MVKSVNFMVLSGIVVLLAWGVNSKNEHAAAARASAVSTYRLNAQQANVYDGCVDAISRKRLKNGGANESFCGCFAGSAADDDAGVKYSVGILRQLTDASSADNDHATRARLTASDSQYFPAFVKAARAAAECVGDQQHTFASNDAHVAWCAAKPERAADRRCRPL